SSRVSLLLLFSFYYSLAPLALHSFPTRRSSDLAVFFLPHLRIPEVMDTAAFRNICFVQHRIHLILLVIHSVTHGKALGLHITVFSVCLTLPKYSGIHQQLSAVRERYRAPGKASVSVISLIR